MYLSRTKTLNKYIWIACVIVAVMFTQGVQLHVHVYDTTALDHDQLGQMHSSYDTSGTEHPHPGKLTEIDLSYTGFVKTSSLGTMIAVFLVTFLVLITPLLLCTRVEWRRSISVPLDPLRDSPPPPLRAPPL